MSRSEGPRPAGPAAAEDGLVFPVVIIVAVFVGALVAAMYASARTELELTASGRDFEAAIHSAESAVEAVFAEVLTDVDGTSARPVVETWPLPVVPNEDPGEERRAVVDLVLSDPDAAVVVGDDAVGVGLAYGIGPFLGPDDHHYVYGVSAAEPGALGDGSYRVIRTRLADLAGEPGDDGGGGGGPVNFGSEAVHLNGGLVLSGNVERLVDGGISAHGPLRARNVLGERLRAGNLVASTPDGKIDCLDSWCPQFRETEWSGITPLPIGVVREPPPVLDAIDVHRRYASEIGAAPGVGAWYDLCYPDAARYGHSHPTVRQAPTTYGAPPCSGEEIQRVTGAWPTATYRGWQYEAGSRTWTKSSGDGGYPDNGVYYAHERNIRTSDLWNTSARLTVIASADPADASHGFGGRSGNVDWQGNSHLYHYDGVPGFGLAVFADRDVFARGTAWAEGVVYAREQALSTANNFQILGTVQAAGVPIGPVAAGAKSSPGSLIDREDVEWGPGGGFRITYVEYSFETDPGPGGDGPGDGDTGPPTEIRVRSWVEL